MPKKIMLKTAESNADVAQYFESLANEAMQEQGHHLDALFQEVTGVAPKMWGASIVGYGRYTYYRANGDEGEYLATGFSMRKSGPVIYTMVGYETADQLLEKLGPHKLGKSCLYLKRLSDIDLSVLKMLISDGLERLKNSHPVQL